MQQEYDQAGAEKAYKRSIKLNPRLNDVYNAYAGKGFYDKAISKLQQFGHIPLQAACLVWQFAKRGKREEARNSLINFLERL